MYNRDNQEVSMARVIYERNPLIEVILQMRFPTILSINSNDPVDFQEAIRKEYPIYQLGIENEQEIEIVAQKDTFFPTIKQKNQHKNHTFISADGKYKINLTSSFISISTVDYVRWEELLERFSTAIKAFLDIYEPPFFERIGLRYIDAFSRKKLELENKKWSELIQVAWVGPLSNVCEDKMVNLGIDTEFMLDDGISRAKVHTGLGTINNQPEKVFIVDGDFIHIRNIKIGEYLKVLEYLHDNSGKFIQSVIEPTLHEAMKPGELK